MLDRFHQHCDQFMREEDGFRQLDALQTGRAADSPRLVQVVKRGGYTTSRVPLRRLRLDDRPLLVTGLCAVPHSVFGLQSQALPQPEPGWSR